MLVIPTEKRFDWKHAPVVLFIIVVINTVLFFGYQFADGDKVNTALIDYKNQKFLEKEWPIYQGYLENNQLIDRLKGDQELYAGKKYPNSEYRLIYNIISDEKFYHLLDSNSYNIFSLEYIEKWSVARSKINKKINSISTQAYGLIPSELSVVTVVTHQFLHGGIMHLLGNMFFLIICGFAVEAAIGHLRFLLYYLGSGIAGGLLYSVMDLTSTTPLVGASGAISGVMAMYLGVFRFKKIEFFYWFFVFVGYFRAPAMLILPFYIGKELHSYFNDVGSNVAFMAHTGGFIAGGVLMLMTYLFIPDVMNDEYIEEDQDLPEAQKDLAKVNHYITQSRLTSAVNSLDLVIKKHGLTFDRAMLRYNLLNMMKSPKSTVAMNDLFKIVQPKSHEVDQLINIWESINNSQSAMSMEDIYKFGWNLTTTSHVSTAEKIFIQLNEYNIKHPNLGMFARKLSVVYGKLGDIDKKASYELMASGLIEGLR